MLRRLPWQIPRVPDGVLGPARRAVFADKVRAGMILKLDARLYRVVASTRSQKGQNAASFNLKLHELGAGGRKKEVSAAQGHDFREIQAQRVRLWFSGFDDHDDGCFVFPPHHAEAGREVNLPAQTLPALSQDFLCCGMPVDLLHVHADDEEGGAIWTEPLLPSSFVYTVERIAMKGLYRMAALVECDGMVSVNDQVQIGEKIKVLLRPDGTAAFGGRAT
ncbi:unnamed protein product [Phytomonas sp. Hart1]|nr:unnamed protein product [Phytomonas sp. Hart1]|eukprot:CCW70965.1 unnamed protein product [Phytomonas sp. isolate Hart1]